MPNYDEMVSLGLAEISLSTENPGTAKTMSIKKERRENL